MPEIKIIKKEIAIPVDRNENGYGDILFHDKAGKEYKISNKRAHLGSEIIEGHAVELGYGNYMNRDYIAEARLVEGALPPPQPAHIPDEEGATKLKAEVIKYAPQEVGMWLKALGDRIGDGSLEKAYPHSHIEIKKQWFEKCWAVTGIKPKKE